MSHARALIGVAAPLLLSTFAARADDYPTRCSRSRTPRNRFVQQGAAMPLGTPEAFAQFIRAESDRYGEVIAKAGIKLE